MNVFITGAAGYIGGAVAAHLITQGHTVRGLVRDPVKAAALAHRGVAPVLGDLGEYALLAMEAQAADAVVNCADSDHRGCVEALLKGLSHSGKLLLHTSGSSVIGDDVGGDVLSDRIYDESTPFIVEEPKIPRHEIDSMVLASASAGVRGVVLCNTMIYGIGAGLNPHSLQIPHLVRSAQTSGVVRIVGRGINRWSNAHINDVVQLYGLALASAPGGDFYFVENGEASFEEIGRAIAKRLNLGQVQSWSVDDATEAWGPVRYGFGSNSRVRALRARRELNWEPRFNSVLDWIQDDMPLPD